MVIHLQSFGLSASPLSACSRLVLRSSNATLLFVDQPVGTGFSYSGNPLDYVRDEKAVANQLYGFLQAFLVLHPELASRPFFVTGESYAGHYVPAISYKIVQENAAGSTPINLQGMAIGNGLVEPLTQYGAYADYAADRQLIEESTRASINAAYAKSCAPAIQACYDKTMARLKAGRAVSEDNANVLDCAGAESTCDSQVTQAVLSAMTAKLGYRVNVYDYTKPCVGSLCYDFSDVDTYMALPDVSAALGVTGHKWSECSNSVHSLLLGDWMQNLEKNIPDILAAGVRVLVYVGVQDYICNVEGNKRWVDKMAWAGTDAYAAAPALPWVVGGVKAGTAREAKGLSFVEVFKAGHLVPMDVGENALDVLNRFTSGVAFADSEGELARETLRSRVSATGEQVKYRRAGQ